MSAIHTPTDKRIHDLIVERDALAERVRVLTSLLKEAAEYMPRSGNDYMKDAFDEIRDRIDASAAAGARDRAGGDGVSERKTARLCPAEWEQCC